MIRPMKQRQTTPGDYVQIVGLFWAIVTLIPRIARSLGREAKAPTPWEGAQMAMAVYALARIVTEERAGSFLREPFTEAKSDVDEAPPLYGHEQQPTGRHHQAAIGQLLTCSRCFGVWASGGIVALRALAPRQAAVVIPTLALSGTNFFLQASFAALAGKANVIEKEAEAEPDDRESGESDLEAEST
jgi:hypothetical protein